MQRKKKNNPGQGDNLPRKTGESRALESIYPGFAVVDNREAVMVDLPASAAAYFTGGTTGGVLSNQGDVLGVSASSDSTQIAYTLPEDRSARYAVLKLMATDPTIDSALKMHMANALSAKSDSGESVFLESVDGKPNAIVDDLRAALMPAITKDLNEWARKAAVYGSCFTRVYGKPGVGIQNVRCDFYTHPRFVKKFEKGGRLAGFTTTYQGTHANQRLRLLPPWYFVGFEIPEWQDVESVEPISIGAVPVDLSLDDFDLEGLVESQEYGTSLIGTAYGPWMDLLDAICSLKMSRRNAARLERIIGVNTGKLDPERAARYLDMIAEQISSASAEAEKQSWLKGNVQTIVNNFVPIFGDKGGIQIDSVQGTPDINGLEDVLFHVKRLGSAIGVDPSLLGFGDFMSGGLGDGGFFRMSIMAAVKANLLRKAIKNGLERLCEIHVAYKYGKVFMPGDRPWKIRFNSVSSAIEREEQEALESRTNIIGGIIGAVATVDQEFAITEKRELMQVLWKFMRLDDESFNKTFPEGKKVEPAPAEEVDGGEFDE